MKMSKDDLYVPDCLFPSDNDYEVPVLDLNMQAKYLEIPFLCFGEQKRTHKMNGAGTLHFYTDDYRFSTIYTHPEKIVKYDPANMVEPNFSLYYDTPVAFGLQAVYKKRMVARMMQSKGIRIFVDLNVSPKFYEINLLGVPEGWSAFCTRGYEDRLDQLEFELDMAKTIAKGNELTFAVYGGGEVIRNFCKSKGLVYVTPVIIIKNRIKRYERMLNEGIAQGIDDKLSDMRKMLKNNVESF